MSPGVAEISPELLAIILPFAVYAIAQAGDEVTCSGRSCV
jgi:hypothetical protein